jgi:putative transposase
MRTFFQDSDFMLYLRLLREEASESEVGILGYALMSNHVHLIAVPAADGSLHRAIGETHRRYTRLVNEREGWKGYLWQGRFSSCPMDQEHLLNAARYIEMNPVRAGLVERPEDYPWSSARAHLGAEADDVVESRPLLDLVHDWRGHLAAPVEDGFAELFRSCGRTGRPMGSHEFIIGLETRLGRSLRKRRPGRKPAARPAGLPGELSLVSPDSAT